MWKKSYLFTLNQACVYLLICHHFNIISDRSFNIIAWSGCIIIINFSPWHILQLLLLKLPELTLFNIPDCILGLLPFFSFSLPNIVHQLCSMPIVLYPKWKSIVVSPFLKGTLCISNINSLLSTVIFNFSLVYYILLAAGSVQRAITFVSVII